MKLVPDIYAEMEGIAEGAELEILDIVALNCRSEIALGKFSDGCTTLCWKKSDNARVLSQNWDWATPIGQNIAMVSIEQVGKPTLYMVTEVRYFSRSDRWNCVLIDDRRVLLVKSGSIPPGSVSV
jgi:isopenicillin-N N-acyltransferase-like protein